MGKWKEELLKDAERVKERAKEQQTDSYEAALDKILKAYRLKVRIIGALRSAPNALFGDTMIFVRTGDHLLVHDVSKELGIELKRSAQSDGFNFEGDIEGVHINVYGMREVPHCKIVPRKVMKEVTEYEVVCNEEAK